MSRPHDRDDSSSSPPPPASPSAPSYSSYSVWTRNLTTPLREFLRTEVGSAVVLVLATVGAVAWANAAPGAYAAFWGSDLVIRVGGHGLSQDLRHWVNDGLMTFFFFVVGLEARRELDMGDLRERRQVVVPLLAGLSGMLVPVGIYLALNAGHSTAHGWGAAMSTDTAFALGLLSLFGSRFPRVLRTFILSVTVVDDLVALCVITVAYSGSVSRTALLVGVGVLVVVLVLHTAGVRRGPVDAVLGGTAWVAFFLSGVEAVVVGLVMGLLTYAYPAVRSDLERASDLFREFREQPTPELERSARRGLAEALSPNERLQRLYHPWTSYVIVPLFALANAGVTIGTDLLSRAVGSPVTWGILLAYTLGKPCGIAGSSWLAFKLSKGRLRPSAGWAAVTAGGTIAGVGFTVSLLIATLAFHGEQLAEAKLGVLAAVLCALPTTWTVALVVSALPPRWRARALYGTAQGFVDLAEPVDPERDRVRGPHDAPVTLVEYGDFECPYCGQAEPIIRDLLASFGDEVRYVWRHLPLSDVHPHARLAAEATEAAAEQGAFWEMHDRLLDHQGELERRHLIRYAEEMGLDTERFRRALRSRAGAVRIAQDMESADLSGVSGTPTFFVNGRRHHGPYDVDSLSAAVEAAVASAR
ncbi:Na(+)/H(+) antiporter NhaA 2 [Streptomyces sulfonofaciens]|uniref:Na(+)/H(+) antiporter NhaA n=1 Tax=Streptomyces sulfonofaciens TaxID=68272 RepID=A0A919FTW1_9ACTN|nr:Na+/H+ antiporter NhaA [Streptomyces sulfonofaciens]GHH71988.1 Na(+)/H(+) antiporter NhaA 2 [Streptomyces sulfonofaciens]